MLSRQRLYFSYTVYVMRRKENRVNENAISPEYRKPLSTFNISIHVNSLNFFHIKLFLITLTFDFDEKVARFLELMNREVIFSFLREKFELDSSLYTQRIF